MILSIAWGLMILAILILRVRNVLHTGLMEAALERSAREGGVGAGGELEFCAQCEMPLLDHAAFCNACGTAVRVQPKAVRAKLAVGAGNVDAATIIPGMDDATYEAAGGQGVENPGQGPGDAPPDRTAAEDPTRRPYDEEGRA